jgi:hypothetical protein
MLSDWPKFKKYSSQKPPLLILMQFIFFELIVTWASGIQMDLLYQLWFSSYNLVAVKMVKEELLVSC